MEGKGIKYRKESEKIEMKGNVKRSKRKDAMGTIDKTWPVTLLSVNAYMQGGGRET